MPSFAALEVEARDAVGEHTDLALDTPRAGRAGWAGRAAARSRPPALRFSVEDGFAAERFHRLSGSVQ